MSHGTPIAIDLALRNRKDTRRTAPPPYENTLLLPSSFKVRATATIECVTIASDSAVRVVVHMHVTAVFRS